MSDVISQKRRSEIMSHIKSKDTSIELLVRKKLHSLGYRFRVNYKSLPGKPDVVFTKRKIAVFIQGCFWHGHEIGCRFSHRPQFRQEYWDEKISKTILRDASHIEELSKNGWQVMIIWECEIKTAFDDTINKLIELVGSPK